MSDTGDDILGGPDPPPSQLLGRVSSRIQTTTHAIDRGATASQRRPPRPWTPLPYSTWCEPRAGARAPAACYSSPMSPYAPQIAQESQLDPRRVTTVLRLLDEGATVPFIARYRKEATGGLDEVAIRDIESRAAYLTDLEARRTSIERSLRESGQLTPQLEKALRAATTKQELEDLYLPYKPKRRTKATTAREQGLEPLADVIAAQPKRGAPDQEARRFVGPKVASVEEALSGAHDILVERIAEDPVVRGHIRDTFVRHGVVQTRKAKPKDEARTKFEDYYDFSGRLSTLPSHRYLALARGEAEGILKVKVEIDEERALGFMRKHLGLDRRSPYADALDGAIAEAFSKRLRPALGKDARARIRERAETEAIDVFARNLRELLLAAPLGRHPVLAIDPGIRTGCKCVALDDTGVFLEHVTIYPLGERAKPDQAARDLRRLVERHRPRAIAVGNGTGGRETESFVRSTLADIDDAPIVVSVSESGASIYSASDIARQEFPDLDLTIRGAISIGRRLQDPLAELVKLDPKSIGVGQYQHDVDQAQLAKKLAEVVESCVNAVGVELNTASAPLLAHVAGVGPKLAAAIALHRQRSGAFERRKDLLSVKGLGPKAFEQCAGFLRIQGGTDPLDASAVHPERYDVVRRMAADLGQSVDRLIGNDAAVSRIDPSHYEDGDTGELTIADILDELRKPGRDPRASFEAPAFRDDIREIEDLREGMVLEGIVTNVTAFGAFVDVGVHQDGLVHISELAERFVRDPNEVVHVGQRLRVKVLSVDVARRRIGLSAKKAKG